MADSNAMYIPEEKISEILNTSDIVDIVSQSVILKKSGRNFFGLCPFHSEKTPSFSVNPDKQIFHCFGCGSGGDAIGFTMKYHGLSFLEAARMLARKYNITIETRELDPAKRDELRMRENLFRLNRIVMKKYADLLLNSQEGENARGYLARRKMEKEIMEQFHLGYVSDAWDTIVNEMKRNRISQKLAVNSGLVIEKKQGSGFYDRFRNRVMFPIFDINMQIAGFGGRVMDDSMPKYMNSPETMIYNKSRILYGLHASKQHCRQEGSVYIVEGYFDFLSLFQHGIRNCAASLGTALTREHVRVLKGYASRMILVFDSDDAGINAAKKSIKTFIQEGVDTRILVLPKNHDPDSFVSEHGAAEFVKQAENAKTALQFLLQVAIDTHGLSVEGRLGVLNDMKAHLAQIKDSALRSLHIKELAEKLNIDEKAVLEKVRERYLQSNGTHGKNIFSDKSDGSPDAESDRREEQIISMVLNFPEIAGEIKESGVFDFFYSGRLKKLGRIILSIDTDKGQFVRSVMAKLEDEKDQELIARYAMNWAFENDSGEMQDIHMAARSLINRIIRVRKKQENVLTQKIIEAEKDSGNELMELLKKKQAEIQQLHC